MGARVAVGADWQHQQQNQFDCIDLSDNELVKLEGFPPLKRLSTLLVHNNRITRLSPGLGGAWRRAKHTPPGATATNEHTHTTTL